MPLDFPMLTERFTEFVVIIALMGAGLKLDRSFSWKRWAVTWRLLAVAMPLGIGAVWVVGISMLGLPWIAALLLGAVLAPTDPVLAADVQVGPPRTGEEDEVRFGLTSEAGLNDGLAFPFVHLAIALALSAQTGEPWLKGWLLHNFLWEIGIGVIGGWLVGKLFGWLTFHVPAETKLARTGDGLIAISATFVSYGVTDCYGILAVFVTALTLRRSHRNHQFQPDMHSITEESRWALKLRWMIEPAIKGVDASGRPERSAARQSASWRRLAVHFSTCTSVEILAHPRKSALRVDGDQQGTVIPPRRDRLSASRVAFLGTPQSEWTASPMTSADKSDPAIPADGPRRGPLGDARPSVDDPAPTRGGLPPEDVDDRPNVGTVKPEDYPEDQRAKG